MEMQVLDKRDILGQQITTYGDIENPLFLAKEVANWIEHTHTTNMLKTIDEDEKLNVTILHAGQNREVTMLTEEGLYEVLFQSKKPIAKEFKKRVKKVLKELRMNKTKNQLSPMEQLRLQYQVIENHENKIERIEAELENFPLQTVECDEISKTVKRVGVKVLGGIGSKAYKNSSLRAKIYSDIHKQLKREFNINSYKAIKRKYLDSALKIIENYNPPFVLNDEINMKNKQMAFGEV